MLVHLKFVGTEKHFLGVNRPFDDYFLTLFSLNFVICNLRHYHGRDSSADALRG